LILKGPPFPAWFSTTVLTSNGSPVVGVWGVWVTFVTETYDAPDCGCGWVCDWAAAGVTDGPSATNERQTSVARRRALGEG
jgi:hypothetical protein